MHLLSRIAPPAIRIDVCARVERQKQSTRETHSLFDQIPATRRLQSRRCFLSSVQPANFPTKIIKYSEWQKRLRNKSHNVIDIINLHKELEKVMIVHGPHGYVSTVCAQGIHAAKHKGKSGSSTQETPHVLVEKQKKPRHTCYSAPNSHIPALWMTLLCSTM